MAPGNSSCLEGRVTTNLVGDVFSTAPGFSLTRSGDPSTDPLHTPIRIKAGEPLSSGLAPGPHCGPRKSSVPDRVQHSVIHARSQMKGFPLLPAEANATLGSRSGRLRKRPSDGSFFLAGTASNQTSGFYTSATEG
jgi:hypothetical protein